MLRDGKKEKGRYLLGERVRESGDGRKEEEEEELTLNSPRFFALNSGKEKEKNVKEDCC